MDNTVFPCTLLDHFDFIRDAPDPAIGMWEVRPQLHPRTQGGRQLQTVEHLNMVLRAVHLLPKFGYGFMPYNWPHSLTLDAFETFYVNKFADHQLHEILS